MFNVREMSPVERRAMELAFQLLDPETATPELRSAYESVILEKWSTVKYTDPRTQKAKTFDWLGKDAEELGFPKIESEKGKREVAVVLENQYRYQQRKRRAVKNGFLSEPSIMADTQTGDEALPTNFALAMVRRAYSLMQVEDWSTRQPMHAPTAFVWFIDFIREADTSNLLSNEYAAFITPEAGVPTKGKIALQRVLVQANKQLMGTVWTLEASEDAMAQLGLNIEQELISAFTAEFVRDRFAQHLKTIYQGSLTATAVGTSLPTPWSQAGQSAVAIPNQGTNTLTDWGRAIYNALVDADAAYIKLNRQPSNGIVCGVDLAARLQRANQAVDAKAMSDAMQNDLGINDFGHFSGRWHIWATDLLPSSAGFLYRRNPDTLRAGHVYAPYVPIQVMPAVYAGYTGADGRYTNTDEYTRNIRERSAEVLTKPYAFVPLTLG